MPKFTRIAEDTFKNLQLNAGFLVKRFNVETGEAQEADLLGATTGGINFSAVPTFTDLGDGIDNCPKNTKELKRIDAWDITISGTYTVVTADNLTALAAAADTTTSGKVKKVTPRLDLKTSDFKDIWWVGDYTGEGVDGFVAVHLLDALSTGGVSLQTADRGKGQLAFTYTAHTSMATQTVVPFEAYIYEGNAAA